MKKLHYAPKKIGGLYYPADTAQSEPGKPFVPLGYATRGLEDKDECKRLCEKLSAFRRT